MRILKETGLVIVLTFTLIIAAFPFMMPMAHASPIRLNPVADSWVESKYPTVNHGWDQTLHCRSDTSPLLGNITKRVYLKFNVTGIDSDAIGKATLYLYCTEATISPNTMDVDVHKTGDDWIEGKAVGDIDWTNAPAIGDYLTTTAVGGVNQSYGWGGDAMKNYVKVEAAGDGIVSFVVKLPNDTEYIHPAMWHRDFSSKEGSNKPYLEILEKPVACFTVSNDRPTTCETVTFNASCSYDPDGSIVKYEWDWEGDSIYDFDAGTNPIATHHYNTHGSYHPKLRVTDNDGLTDEINGITILVRGHPVAAFTWTPPTPTVYETVTFNASSSTPDGGNITKYQWNFGDDSPPVTEADPITNHTYTEFGTYDVTLTIVDSEDLTDTFTDTLRILIHPVANFTYSPTKPIVDETVTFNASASYDPDQSIDSIDSYEWDFDDGNITTVSYHVITHAYTVEGTYNVTLTVIDDDNLTDTIWKLITVYSKLITVYLHDVAVTDVAPSLTEVNVGEVVSITVVAKNEGTANETFNVTVYYDENIVETKGVTDLAPGKNVTLTFSWDTSGVSEGDYTIKAVASQVPGETDIGNNEHVDGTITVKSPSAYGFPRELAILAFIVAAAILLTLLAFLLYRRRKRKSGLPQGPLSP